MKNAVVYMSLFIMGICAACAGPGTRTFGPDGKLVLPLERETRNGNGNGPEVVSNAGFTNPGLAGFSFNFIGDVDDEIERIKVIQTLFGIGIEYSPTLPNHRDYSWIVIRQQLPSGTKYYQKTGSYDGSATLLPHSILRGEQAKGVPVLVGFSLWRGMEDKVSDFEIKVFRYQDRSNEVFLSIAFGDRDSAYGDPPFSYQVDFAIVPERKVVKEWHHLGGYAVTGSASRNINAKYPVLQGFRLEFVDDDGNGEEHNLDQVGVLVSPSRIQVAYNDKNDDDRFRWEVWFADVKDFNELTGPEKLAPGPAPSRIEDILTPRP